jgi:hypothetical protein
VRFKNSLTKLPHSWVNKQVARASALVLAGLVGFLGWKSLNGLRAPVVALAPAPVSLPTTKPALSVDGIVNEHLFGSPATAATIAVTPPPSTWHVAGIVASPRPQDSVADIIIDGVAHVWHVGDQLPDGSTLTAIDGNSITVSRASGNTLLPFELRPISYDDHFDILAVNSQADSSNPSNVVVAAPEAHPVGTETVSDRLTALRTAGIAEWVKRNHSSPPIPSESPHP